MDIDDFKPGQLVRWFKNKPGSNLSKEIIDAVTTHRTRVKVGIKYGEVETMVLPENLDLIKQTEEKKYG